MPTNDNISGEIPSIPNPRVGWVDVVKGISIFLVVMMHSTLGVQNALGEASWMGQIVEFARPFRIPCFMLVSGLFLHRSINTNWPQYFDRKILHFIYFYLLWVAIQVVIKTPAWMGEGQTLSEIFSFYLMTFVQPFGTLWFIYLLPIFYFATRLLRNFNWKIVLGAALILQILPIHTGSILIDEFASRYVYFFIGYQFHRHFFDWATLSIKKTALIVILLALWFVTNAWFTNALTPQFLLNIVNTSPAGPIAKFSDLPLISLALAIAGSLAMITLGAIIMQVKSLSFMRWVGQRSIVVYLAFFLPMAISRILLIKFADDILSTGTIAAIVTISAAIGPLIFYWFIKKIGYGMFLFERPAIAKNSPVLN